MSKMSLDGEPHAETTFLSHSFEHSKMITTFSQSQRRIQTKQRNGQHGEAPRSEKQLVVDMFAKSGFGTREIRSQMEKREKLMFELEFQYFR